MEHINLIVGTAVGVLTILGFVTGAAQRTLRLLVARFAGPDTALHIPRKTLVLLPKPGRGSTWWHLGSVGDQPAMQIVGSFTVTNITRLNILPAVAKMRKPALLGHVMVKDLHSDYHGAYPIPPAGTTDLSLDFWISPPVCDEGRAFTADLAVVDQFGNEHWLKGVEFKYS